MEQHPPGLQDVPRIPVSPSAFVRGGWHGPSRSLVLAGASQAAANKQHQESPKMGVFGEDSPQPPHFPAAGEDLRKERQSTVSFAVGDKRAFAHTRAFYLGPVFKPHHVQAVISTLAACLRGSW